MRGNGIEPMSNWVENGECVKWPMNGRVSFRKTLTVCLDEEFAAIICKFLCLAFTTKEFTIYAWELNMEFEGYKFWL